MAQRSQIVAELKRALRARGLTYAQVAKHLQLSEASVKANRATCGGGDAASACDSGPLRHPTAATTSHDGVIDGA